MVRRIVRAIKAPIAQWRTRGAAIILMYHRIGEPGCDPWALAVTPAHFAEHLRVLGRVREIVPLRELAMRLVQRKTVSGLAALTFDDGYADNLYSAKPLLEKSKIPATVFVTTGLETAKPFWWDELAWLVLDPGRLGPTVRVQIGKRLYERQLDLAEAHTSDEWRHPLNMWRAWQPPQTKRQEAYVALWRELRALPHDQRESVLEELRRSVENVDEVAATCRSLSADELRSLAKSRSVEIGAHSVTHVSFREIPTDRCRHEIEQSKATLEARLDSPVRTFAYPFGECSSAAVKTLRNEGFVCACTTRGDVTKRTSDRFRLPRVHVQDWDGTEFERRLAASFGGT